MKPDEAEFLKVLQTAFAAENHPFARDIIVGRKDLMAPKRANYLLGKWTDKGWWDFGVSLDLGWLTEVGREAK